MYDTLHYIILYNIRHITSHLISSHRIASHRITSHHITLFGSTLHYSMISLHGTIESQQSYSIERNNRFIICDFVLKISDSRFRRTTFYI